ncbi:MAG: DNA polymerase IV [Clostridia bacterium]|nr:DNA polymerase IV [Clostridia bacterium]
MDGKNQTKERVILHVDANNFFASVECATKPELLGKPVAVTGNPKKRTGIILAKNEIAKKMGVKTGQVIGHALAVCPELVCLPPHYDIYEEVSVALQGIYLDYTNFVEPLGLDECWLDITDSLNYLKKSGKEVADEIREQVKKELGLTVSVGVSFSKIFAKLGSDLRKPDFTTIIPRKQIESMVYPLPLNSIVGIGSRLERKFSSIGVNTIGDFVKLEDAFLKSIMGINGTNLKSDLLGERIVPVLDYYHLPPPKSIGNGTTATKDISNLADISKIVHFLSQKVAGRMIRHKVKGETISVTVKDNGLKTFHKSQKILPTNEAKVIAKEAIKLIQLIYDFKKPVRAVRVKISSLSSANVWQLSMFDSEKGAISAVTEQINQKYGKIFLASNLADFINTSNHPQE